MNRTTVDIGEPNVSTYSDDALRKLREHPDAAALTVALINEVLELRAAARGKPLPPRGRRSWTRFCEWVQGKKVVAEMDIARDRTVLTFEGGATATVFSSFDTKFGEMAIEPPMVHITEGP